jgi:DNA end-binding protein Ku
MASEGSMEPNEEGAERPSKRPIWTGSVTIGLVNIPVKVLPMIYDKEVTFRFLHKEDGQPLKYQRVCTKDEKVVPWSDIVKGFEVAKGEFVILSKEELAAARPESDERIRVDKFVDYLSVEPIYFERSYILAPNKSEEAYKLLYLALEKMGKAAAGRVTLRTKEYPVLIHVYKGALVMTTLRYAGEVRDPSGLEELAKLKEPSKGELEIAMRIVKDLSGDFDIQEYKDGYKEKVERLVAKKMKGERVREEKPVKEEAKELMAALQETLEQLKKK